MAAKTETLKVKKRAVRKKKGTAEAASRGLAPRELSSDSPPANVESLKEEIERDGGSVLGVYRDPIGGHWQILAGLPVDKVQPTPYQRDISEAHVARLGDVINRLDRFLDPIIAVRSEEGRYWTPNGHHRLAAVRRLGGKSVVALVLPDAEIAYRILALNTEKAHNLREKALEVIRMARALAGQDGRSEKEFALEFEEPAFATLGICYEKRPRFSGGAYNPVLRRVEVFLEETLPQALMERERRADLVLELDDAVAEAIQALKARGFNSPFLRAFVVGCVNPLRFQRDAKADFDATIEKMIGAARRFDPSKVKPGQLAAASGPPEE